MQGSSMRWDRNTSTGKCSPVCFLLTLCPFSISSYSMSHVVSSSQSGAPTLTFSKRWDSTYKTDTKIAFVSVCLFWLEWPSLMTSTNLSTTYLLLHPSIHKFHWRSVTPHTAKDETTQDDSGLKCITAFLLTMVVTVKRGRKKLSFMYKLAIHNLRLIKCTFK